MKTIFYDVWDEEQIGWLILDSDGKYHYKSLRKNSLMDAKGNVHLGKFGETIGRKEKVDPAKEKFKREQEELEEENKFNKFKEEHTEKWREYINKGDRREQVYPVFRYKNYSRKSGVYAYAISPDKKIIYVYFLGKKRGWYKYDTFSAPAWIIKEMVQRAKKGWGLNRFINQHPKTYYWKGQY